ncbi:sigma-70 family RNA polymerase sigma factor [Terrabacter sp. NPDC080008]|uniref:RNA polymerase sigma factor n=1 Tax=Terrabacter sp. NPDC080008 TaxID=3155176 RepID=UPI00344EDFAC
MIGQEFETLLADARDGNEAAFARLWRDLNPALLRYLALGEQAPEEVAAETWLVVVKGLRTFTGDEMAWRAWVFTTARRRAIDAARKRARESRFARRGTTWVAPVVPDCAEEVEQLLTTAEAIALVRRLPPLQAEVVLLRVVAELSVEEVAGLVGRSPGAVRVAGHRGLKTLAAMVGGTGVTQRTFRTLREVT